MAAVHGTHPTSTMSYPTTSPMQQTKQAPSNYINTNQAQIPPSDAPTVPRKRRTNKQLNTNSIPYELGHKAVRQIDLHSEEDWDAVADHAAIEWGQRRGPRRGRDADDLTVTVRDIAPGFSKLLDKLGCCGETKSRTLHRPQAPCHPVQQIHTECGGMMSSSANGVYFPQGVLLETGLTGMGKSGVGHQHGIDSYGGYRYYGERESTAVPSKFETYDTWRHPDAGYATLNKTPLPQFAQSFHNRAFNAAPGLVETEQMRRVLANNDTITMDDHGKVIIPEFVETKDGKLSQGVRV